MTDISRFRTVPSDPESARTLVGPADSPEGTVPFVIYPNSTNPHPHRDVKTWSALCEMLTTHDRGPKNGPMWSPVRLVEGGTRKDIYVQAVTCLVLDFDGVPFDPADLGHVAAIVHSTHSHSPTKPSFRIVLRLDREVTPAEFSRVWRAAVECVPGADPACKALSNAYFTPRAPEGAEVFAQVIDGPPLIVDQLLAESPEEPERGPVTVRACATLSAGARARLVELLLENWPAKGRHDAHLALAGALATRGWQAEDVEDVLVDVGGDRPKRAATVRDTFDRIERGDVVKGLPSLIEHIGEVAGGRARDIVEGLEIEEDLFAFFAQRAANDEREPDPEPPTPPKKKVLSPKEALAELNASFALVESPGLIMRTDATGSDVVWLTPSTFKLVNDNRSVRTRTKSEDGESEENSYYPLGSFWLKSSERRTYQSAGMYPPPRIAPPTVLNLWQGFAIEPKKGDWSKMRAHLRDVICSGNAANFEYLERWLAWTFQNPGLPAEAAIVLQGKEGVGKGILGNALCRIFGEGRHAFHVTSGELFVGQFNGHFVRTSFLFADECMWSGDKKAENRLKGMVTEPSLSIEDKRVRAFSVPNCLHVLTSTNERWAIPAGPEARRYAVYKVSDSKIQNKEYFTALVAELDHGGREAMLFDLLEFELGNWHPREIVKTKALREQQELSLDIAPAFVLSILESGDLPSDGYERGTVDTVPSKVLDDAIERFARGRKARAPRLQDVTALLVEIGAKKDRVGTGPRGWKFLDLKESRRKWDAYRRYVREWNELDSWA